MNPVEQIQEFIREYPELIEAAGPAGEDQMRRVREHFGPVLPDSLEKYLRSFGSLSIPPEEFAGVSPADPEGESFPDLIRMHRNLVNDLNMPPEYVPLLSEDGDSYLVLMPSESATAVFRWIPNTAGLTRAHEDLLEMLVERCEELIEDETQEWTGWEERISTCRWFEKVGTGEIEGAERVSSWGEVAEWLGSSDYEKAKEFSRNGLQRVLKRGGILPTWEAAFEEQGAKIDRLLKRSIVAAVREGGLPEGIVADFREHALRLLVSFPFMGPDYDALDRRMVELYLEGYCPCGFRGRYPRGTLIVF